jgi:hypothetical protein
MYRIILTEKTRYCYMVVGTTVPTTPRAQTFVSSVRSRFFLLELIPLEDIEKPKRGRPQGRTGETWSVYVSVTAIKALEAAAARRNMTPGRYLEAIVDVLEGFVQPAQPS